AIAVEVQLDLVLTGLNVQTLERAVEVVDDAGVVAVDVDLGFVRLHLELHRRLWRQVRAVVRRINAPRSVPRINPERRVERRVKPADHDDPSDGPATEDLRVARRREHGDDEAREDGRNKEAFMCEHGGPRIHGRWLQVTGAIRVPANGSLVNSAIYRQSRKL